MPSRRTFLASAAGVLASAALPRAIAIAVQTSPPVWPLPPPAARFPTAVGGFGHSRIDDYAWLRPADWPAVLRDPSTLDAPIRAQIDAENAYAEAMLAPTRPLQAELRTRIETLAALRKTPDVQGATLPGAEGDASATAVVATPDGRFVFWLRAAGETLPAAVLRRELGTGDDVLVYAESDPAFALDLRASGFGSYAVVRSHGTRSSEVRLLSLAHPTEPPLLIEPRTPELEYDVDEWDGRLLLRTNADGAHDFKLVTTTVAQPARTHWQTLVPHVPGRVIMQMHPFADVLVRLERRDALPRLVLMRTDGREHDVAFDEAAYALTVPADQDGEATEMRFTLESPRTPPTQRVLDLASGRHLPVAKADEVPRVTLDPARFEVRRIAARAADGVEIPVTVLMRAGQILDGSAPLMLIAYGGYGVSIEAEFEPPALALVERGWVHAIAHVRGGGEHGAGWWHPTLRGGKQTTFEDFIACADHLADAGYGSRGRIVGFGLSAGGTLMGVVGNLRPELWAGLIAPVAFMDVLTSLERYADHPLGASGIPIWGDPADPLAHAFVESFSPYDQLRPVRYPALFTTAVIDDDAVSFWEPLKFAIKARTLTTAGQPILAYTAPSGGHLDVWGAYPGPEQQAAYLAFAIWAVDRRWGDVPQRPVDEGRAG